MKALTFIKSAKTENTGGNIMLDFITLKDDQVLVISDYMVGLYKSMESFDNGEEPVKYFEYEGPDSL